MSATNDIIQTVYFRFKKKVMTITGRRSKQLITGLNRMICKHELFTYPKKERAPGQNPLDAHRTDMQ